MNPVFKIDHALELNRVQNKRPVATLAAVAQARKQSSRSVAPKTISESRSNKKFEASRAAALRKKIKPQTEIPAIGILAREKIEFTISEKLVLVFLIFISAIGDILDFVILFGGVTEGISAALDTFIIGPLLLILIGANVNNRKVAKTTFGKIAIKVFGIENIPIVSMFYLRTLIPIKAYRARTKAAREGIETA